MLKEGKMGCMGPMLKEGKMVHGPHAKGGQDGAWGRKYQIRRLLAFAYGFRGDFFHELVDVIKLWLDSLNSMLRRAKITLSYCIY